MISILIVDDQKTVQEVLRSYIEGEPGLEIVGLANDGQMALELVEAHRPDIVLMDIEMPAIDGLTATRIISERFVETKVLILSVHDDDIYLNSALQIGAKGYLLKNTPAKELINAIYSAYKGYFQLGPGLLEKYLYKVSSSPSNSVEVEQLKQIIEKQAKLLEQIHNRSNGQKTRPKQTNRSDNQARQSLNFEKQLYSLQYQVDKLNKNFLFLQNYCFIVTLIGILLLSIVFLVTV
jgi:DNA-binding NarL/FixJ family response regulator